MIKSLLHEDWIGMIALESDLFDLRIEGFQQYHFELVIPKQGYITCLCPDLH